MVKVKALKDCKFGHEGQMFIFKEGEEREIDVPIEQIDTRSFEFKGEKMKIEKVSEKKMMIENEGLSDEDLEGE